MTRREFVGGVTAFATAGAPRLADAAKPPQEMRAVLFQWGNNMWGESLPKDVKSIKGGRLCHDHVRFDEALWRNLVDHVIRRGLNTVLIDLGEFPIYPSRPELAVKGSKSPDWIRAEVRRLKSLGL